MYIASVSLRNVRAFENLHLNLSENQKGAVAPPRLRTVLIGKNGTGKTTLLRAIAVGLADGKDASGLLSEPNGSLVAEGHRRATIKITLCDMDGQNRREYRTEIEKENGSDKLHSKKPHKWHGGSSSTPLDILVCGYGIGRCNYGPVESRGNRVIDSSYSLFNYEATLADPEVACYRLRKFLDDDWNRFWERMKVAIGLPEDTILATDLNGLYVSGESIGKKILLKAWADGCRNTLTWLFDLYTWAMMAKRIDKETFEISGIVLMDEIEQHLHPSLQISQLSRLSALVGRVQIVATTHSPFVALGANAQELVALRRTSSTIESIDSLPNFRGFSVEDIVRHKRLFDAQVYNKQYENILYRYRNIVKIPESNRTPSVSYTHLTLPTKRIV